MVSKRFFKNFECSRQSRCPHPYAIRYRDATGRQCEETGYANQTAALDRLNKVYDEKRNTPRHKADLKREIGKQRFGEYASTWLPQQRHYVPGSVRSVNQVLHCQVLPVLESRRMNTFASTVIEDFIMSMEERSVGLATQQNAFDTLKKILLDAYRRDGITENPLGGVIPPEYIPRKITIPTLDETHARKAAGSDELVLLIGQMSGCGLRNGEAYVTHPDRMVADDVYRITEQIDGRTRQPARLKHRKPGEFRESPMPWTVRESVLRFERSHGVGANGYFSGRSVRITGHTRRSTTSGRWRRRGRASRSGSLLTPCVTSSRPTACPMGYPSRTWRSGWDTGIST